MIVVGLSGKARTGKSHLTRELFTAAEHLGWDVKTCPFAGPLKRSAEEKGFGKDKNPEEYRKYCQEHGAGMRAENPDHWVNLWMEDIKALAKEELEAERPLLVLVDDVRYGNEVEILRKHGGVVCYVKHGDRAIEDPNGAWRRHESEAIANELETLDDDMIKDRGYHYVIHNNTKPDALTKWATSFVNTVCVADNCPCEACTSSIENRDPDSRKIDKELRDLLDDIEGKLDDDCDS
jgi:hypothetical protein